MRIIARKTLVAFALTHPETAASLVHWERVTKAARWRRPEDVLASFSKAKTVNAERIRFEISGGDYRMIVAFDFARQVAFVKFVGTHAQYNRVDAATVSLF